MTERMSDDEVRLLGCADISDASVALATHNRMLAEIRRARESEKRLVEALSELATLVEEWLGGAYLPDSFTTQPARKALAAAGVES